MEKRLLSICIPTYNRNYELKRLYDNFLSVVIDKFRDDVEIIVCDNSVPDKANLNEKLFKGTGVIYYANEKMCWGVRNVVHDVIQEHKAVYRICGSGLDDAGNAWKEA